MLPDELFMFVLILTIWILFVSCVFAGPFASTVIDISLNGPNEPYYLPAPGLWINNPSYNKAYKALGPVAGGGRSTPNNNDIVSLGGFGGQIVLAFDHDVENNPANPFGLDAIVFSNALWYSCDANLHFGELAMIEIMPEINGNDVPGDDPREQWYIIAGSHFDPNAFRIEQWDRNDSNLYGYPNFQNWPDSYSTCAFEVFPNYQNENGTWVLVNPYRDDSDPCNDNLEAYWGYAEYTPTLCLGDRNADDNLNSYGDCPSMSAELFYTVPDDPFTVGISPGCGGGDAFDIDWAVDPCTFEPAHLSSFRYIRITTAVDERNLGGVLGEISAEIDGVSDVRPFGDINADQEVNIDDLYLFSQAWLSTWPDENFNPAADFVSDNQIDLRDYAQFAFGYLR